MPPPVPPSLRVLIHKIYAALIIHLILTATIHQAIQITLRVGVIARMAMCGVIRFVIANHKMDGQILNATMGADYLMLKVLSSVFRIQRWDIVNKNAVLA